MHGYVYKASVKTVTGCDLFELVSHDLQSMTKTVQVYLRHGFSVTITWHKEGV